MLKRILLSSICIVLLLLSACQPPASTLVPTESSTISSSKTNNISAPTFTPTPSDAPVPPNIDEDHYRSFYYYAYNSIATIKSWNLIMDTSNPNYLKSQQQYLDLYNLLAESYETARLHYPDTRQKITDVVTKKYQSRMNQKSVQDLLSKLNAFFDSVEHLNVQEQQQLVDQTVADFGLDENNPTPTFQPSAWDGNTKYTFDPQDPSDVSNLQIMMLKPITNNDFDAIEVNGPVFDPNSLQLQLVGPLQVAGFNLGPKGYLVDIQVTGAVDWANVFFKKNGKVVAYYLAANRPLGLPHLMAMRPLPLTQEGRNLMTPPTYGASDPIKLPVLPQDQLENQMRQNLSDALAKGVAKGDISQDESDNLLGKFDDPQVIAVIKDPEIRAAVLLAASLKSVGGDMVLPKILDPNHPIQMFFEDDPAADLILQAHHVVHPPYLNNGARATVFSDNGTEIVLWGLNGKQGQEPIEALATFVVHEVIVHNDLPDSYAEEVIGNLVESLAWIQLIQRDPPLVAKGTFDAQFNNMIVYALMNSIFVDDTTDAPFVSHVGLTSRITGVQTHDDIGALPGNNVQPVHSFDELIKTMYAQNPAGLTIIDFSPGNETILTLFKNLFGDGITIPSDYGHLGPGGEIDPDFSDGLIENVLDGEVQNALADATLPQVGPILHMTLDGGSATP